MSSISNDTSTPRRKRRGPAGLALIGIACLLAALGYTAWLVTQVAPAVEDGQVEPALPLVATAVGVIDEAMSVGDTDALRAMLPPVLAGAPSLAYVRVWDTRGNAIATEARGATDLPAIDEKTRGAVASRMTDTAWLERTGRLQLLVDRQRAVTDTLLDLSEAPRTSPTERMVASNSQAEVTTFAITLLPSHPDLEDAVTEMDGVPEALSMDSDPNAFTVATEHAERASMLVEAECAEARALQQTLPSLPVSLTAQAPAETAPLASLWPTVRGRRFLVPLVMTTEAGADVPAGMAEVVVFTRPGLAVWPAVTHAYLGMGLAALGVFLLGLAACAGMMRGARRAREPRPPTAV